jgi:two-component system, NarL family, sensor histidine kinase DegS
MMRKLLYKIPPLFHLTSISYVILLSVSSFVLIVFYYYFGSFPIDEKYLGLGPFFLFEIKYRLIGSLFIIPMVYAFIVFRWRGVFITWLALLAIILPRIIYFSFSFSSLSINLIFFTVPLIIFLLVLIEFRWRQKERLILAERDKERQAFVLGSFKAHEDERRRIAQELHDDTIQTLIAVATSTHSVLAAEVVKADPSLVKNTEWIRDTVFRVVEDLRRLTLDLRPSILDNRGLVPALRWLANNLSYDNQINTRITVKGQVRKLKSENEVIIFRIIQEALNNILKHSHATRAGVTLEFTQDQLKIFIKDNGTGFIVPENIFNFTGKGKLGLAGIQQRVRSLNGALELHSQLKKGTDISIVFSLKQIAEEKVIEENPPVL